MDKQLILTLAQKLTAVTFVQVLEDLNIQYDVLDCNLMDYNEDFFNVVIEAEDGPCTILFTDGRYIDSDI